jgi:formate dehydrogenase iron-sulfur subunit
MVQIARHRVDQLKANGQEKAAVYDPPGVGGTGVVYVLALGDRPELYGLPKNPTVPWTITIWKSVIKPLGSVAMIGALFGTLFHFVRFGRNEAPGMRKSENEEV